MPVLEQIVHPLSLTPPIVLCAMVLLAGGGLWLVRYVRFSNKDHTSAPRTTSKAWWYPWEVFMLLVFAVQVFLVRWWYGHSPAPTPQQYDHVTNIIWVALACDGIFVVALIALALRAWPGRTYANRPFSLIMFSLSALAGYQMAATAYYSRLIAWRAAGAETELALSGPEVVAYAVALAGSALAFVGFVWTGLDQLHLMRYARPHKLEKADPHREWWTWLQYVPYMGIGYPFFFWQLPPPPPPRSNDDDPNQDTGA